jgi:hypothetical protein
VTFANPEAPMSNRALRHGAQRVVLEHAALLHGPARAAAYQDLSLQIERNVAPFAVYSVPVQSEFFSGRIGCRTGQPVIGAADIGSLCVRGH